MNFKIHIIKINFTCFLENSLIMTTIKLKITYVACIIFQLRSSGQNHISLWPHPCLPLLQNAPRCPGVQAVPSLTYSLLPRCLPPLFTKQCILISLTSTQVSPPLTNSPCPPWVPTVWCGDFLPFFHGYMDLCQQR